jgi:hypothetical protein
MDYRHIQFCDRKSQIDYYQLQELFRLGAFWAKDRKIEDWEVAIANSEPVISVWDGDRLIGFARAPQMVFTGQQFGMLSFTQTIGLRD